jgi:uncharacterized protein YqeY
MNLTERINNDIKEAMKAQDKGRLEALRAIKSAILLANTDGTGSRWMRSVKLGCFRSW